MLSAMQRPLSLKLLSALLLLLALLAVPLSVVVLRETGSKEVLAEAEAAKVVMALRVGAAMLGTFALIEALLAVGLWRGSRLGWWMSVAFHACAAILFAYEAVSAHSRDAEDILFVIVPVVLVALHFLPAIRKWVGHSAIAAIASNP